MRKIADGLHHLLEPDISDFIQEQRNNTGAGKPKRIRRKLIVTVFRKTSAKLGAVSSFRKFSSPTHGLPWIPSRRA